MKNVTHNLFRNKVIFDFFDNLEDYLEYLRDPEDMEEYLYREYSDYCSDMEGTGDGNTDFFELGIEEDIEY